MTLASGSRLGPYEILSPIGAGGMGEVYRARDTRLGREVAVKVLPSRLSKDADRLRRFEKEARSASSLNHPNVVTVYDIGQSEGTSFIAMELVEGVTLRELLGEGALPTKKLLAIAAQLADGLARAHGSGIVHRDLKPDNVMVRKDGLVKILDFGLAKLTQTEVPEGEETHSPTLSAGTEAGVVMGTVGYMSPEQALGKGVDFRSDQFAFGSILYEMATGRRAFQRGSAPETLAAIIREEPEPIRTAAPAVPPPLAWFVERCLAKDPEDRYAATQDLAPDLVRLRDGFSDGSLSGGTTVAAAALPRTRRWILWAAVMAAGAAAALAVALKWRQVEEPPVFRALTFRRGSMGGARFGPDGQTVIYAAAWQGKPMQLYSTRADSTESTALPHPTADLLALSSAGKMAISINRDTGPVAAEVSLAGGMPRELFEGDIQADYSPTGGRMVIARDGKLEYPAGEALYDPGPDKQVLKPRFSPDGRWIAFIEQSGNRNAIAVVDLAGKKRTLSDGWEWTESLAWHPLTGEVWFSAREFASYGVVNLHAVTLSGRHRVVARGPLMLLVQNIARDGRVLLRAPTGPGEPRKIPTPGLEVRVAGWFPDGKRIFSLAAAKGRPQRMYVQDVAGGEPRPITPEGFIGRAASPDGKFALARNQEKGAFLFPVDGGEPRPLPGATGGATVGFDAAGAGIFFAHYFSVPAKIVRYDIASGRREPWREIAVTDPTGVLQFNRIVLTPDGKSYAYTFVRTLGRLYVVQNLK